MAKMACETQDSRSVYTPSSSNPGQFSHTGPGPRQLSVRQKSPAPTQISEEGKWPRNFINPKLALFPYGGRMFLAMGSTCHSFGPAVVLLLFINTSYENLPCRTGVPSNTTLCPICHISYSQAHHSGKTASEYVCVHVYVCTCMYVHVCICTRVFMCPWILCMYVNVYTNV